MGLRLHEDEGLDRIGGRLDLFWIFLNDGSGDNFTVILYMTLFPLPEEIDMEHLPFSIDVDDVGERSFDFNHVEWSLPSHVEFVVGDGKEDLDLISDLLSTDLSLSIVIFNVP